MIETADDITKDVVLRLRRERNLTQAAFWKPFGTSKSMRSYYENGKTPIPKDVKKLVFMHYVVGIKTDENLAGMRKQICRNNKHCKE